MISISNLRKYYITGNVTTKALDNVSLTIEDGETVSIMGKSGSGKSTILNLVGGMDRVTQGEIIVKDKPITQLKEKELAIYRRRDIGFVFQFFHLLPVLTVRENIMLPLITDDKKVDQKHFEELITILGIEEKLDSYPNQLSGGQQQRVAIARALIHKPGILLADEPTGNLDSENADIIMQLLIECAHKYNQTLVLVTHDKEVAQKTQRAIYIKDGKIVSDIKN